MSELAAVEDEEEVAAGGRNGFADESPNSSTGPNLFTVPDEDALLLLLLALLLFVEELTNCSTLKS